jgi:outer membrane receptor for monomeric catechols
VETFHSRKKPSKLNTNHQTQTRKAQKRSLQNQTFTGKIEDKLISHRSLQTGVEIDKNEREKHTQEAYKTSKSRKKPGQELPSYKSQQAH